MDRDLPGNAPQSPAGQNAEMREPAQRFQQVMHLHQAGRLREAEHALMAWMADHGESPEALFRLGGIAYDDGRMEDACRHFMAAERLEPSHPGILCMLGATLHDLGRLDEAAACYRKAVTIAPKLLKAHNNLGLVLKEQGRLHDAAAAFRSVLAINPAYAAALNNLGSVLMLDGWDAQAAQALQAAIRHQPDCVEAWINLGLIALREQRNHDAIQAFRQALRIDPGNKDALLHSAYCLESDGRLDQAIEVLQKACASSPPSAESMLYRARLLAAVNRTEEARQVYGAVLRSMPASLEAALGARLSLPVVCRSCDEPEQERKRFADGLELLCSDLGTFLAVSPEQLLPQIGWTNFHLAYQGKNDRELQASYAKFVRGLMSRCLPDLMRPISPWPAGQRRLRIGFASALFTRGTVAGYFMSWITGVDRANFETFVYHLDQRQDDTSREIESGSDHFIQMSLSRPGSLEEAARRIREDALDILIYPELGMTPALFPLATLRLAPVQCAGWGHPVTTGIDNIDYYLSSDVMEPADAQDHYTERLVRLCGLGTYYAMPRIPSPANRAGFGLPADRTLYFYPHAPFKIHPDNDALLAEILARDQRGMIVFIGARHPQITNAFVERFAGALSSRGENCDQRFIVLPYLPHEDYLRVNLLCDLMLDSLYWSGGNTTLDAVACGLPVVTLPGAYMRSRQSAGILKIAGVEELIASDLKDYIRIALDLAQNPDLRRRLGESLRTGSRNVFDQRDALRSFEDFLRGAGSR